MSSRTALPNLNILLHYHGTWELVGFEGLINVNRMRQTLTDKHAQACGLQNPKCAF